MIQISQSASRVLAAATLFGAMALAQPTFAQTAATPPSTAPAPATTKTVSPTHHRLTGIEAHLSTLHKKLMITPAQQQQWDAYANVERDKAKTFEDLSNERKTNIDNMSAVDDLRSYAKFTEANADAVKKMVPAFEALYNSMSDAQKKNADQYFAQAEQRRQQHHAKK